MLLVAKVLLISRLLHTKLSKRPDAPPYLETLRSRLARLRRRLLGRIDHSFKIPDTHTEGLVEAMCAFALATSSSPTDVVRHFHHLRLEAMDEHMDDNGEKQNSVLVALRLYVKTLKDTQAIVPGQLSLALQGLKAVPILKSPGVYAQIELNLDIHERWIGEDIKAFTPYIRHDELNRSGAEATLKSWAESAIGQFLRRLKERIQIVENPSQLMHLRKETLELWLAQYQHSLGVRSAEITNGLRDVFRSHATVLIRQKTQELSKIGQSVASIIRNWEPGVTDALPSLWSQTLTSMETSNGAKAFRQKLVELSTGKNEPLSTMYLTYKSWHDGIEDIDKIIQNTKSIRWDDNLDNVDDEDELLGNKHALLSKDDPRLLENALHENLNSAFSELSNRLTQTASMLDSSQRGAQATFLLRTWREIRLQLPSCFHKNEFGLDAIHNLLQMVAATALASPLESCFQRFSAQQLKHSFSARALWEGNPELPVLPSPWAYRLLLDVVQAMAEFGSDMWSPEAVKTIKREMTARLAPALEKASQDGQQLDGHDTGDSNPDDAGGEGENAAEDDETSDKAADGDEKDGEASPLVKPQTNGSDLDGNSLAEPEVWQDKQTQQLFDIYYLINATTVYAKANNELAEKAGNGLVNVTQLLSEDISLESRLIERLKKNAAEYWKRTGLLFGLLAQ